MWVSETVCVDPREYFELVRREIAGARSCVVMEMYIFEDDFLGETLLQELRHAAARGVNVRLVVDGVGSPRFNTDFLWSLGRQGIAARVYHPTTPRFFKALRSPSLRRLRGFFSSINKRNHRKLVVIDQSVAFVGSCNVADTHQGWRETAARVTGGGVKELWRSFELIWSRSSHPGLRWAAQIKARVQARRVYHVRYLPTQQQLEVAALVRMNYSRRLRIANNASLAMRIGQAVHRVWVTNAYFVPAPAILAALLRAARSGCDVKLILPSKTDVSVVSYVSRMFYRRLMLAGVKIYEYQPSVLHAKTLLIDDWVCVGTTNLNHRSFYHDLEVDVALHDNSSKVLLDARFKKDLDESKFITMEQLSRRSYLEQLGGYLVYPFRRFI